MGSSRAPRLGGSRCAAAGVPSGRWGTTHGRAVGAPRGLRIAHGADAANSQGESGHGESDQGFGKVDLCILSVGALACAVPALLRSVQLCSGVAGVEGSPVGVE